MRIIWTAPASRDLLTILDYLSRIDRQRADKLEMNILASVERLADFPHRGRPGRRAGSRELLVTGTPYLVVYAVRADRVNILRVWHAAQNRLGRG